MSGWIKLHRQFRDSPYYKVGAASQTWIECLMRASHDTREVFLKREKITLQPGQFVMGREEFGQSIGISGSTAWYWILQFEADSMVDIKKTAKGSIVSVKNWLEYQKPDSTSDNRKTADEQQMNTNKKDKKVKNEKKEYDVRPETKSLHEYIDALCQELGMTAKVNITLLDELVARYKGPPLRDQIRKCMAWMVDHGKREITTLRITNWLSKAGEISKRDELKRYEWQQAQKDPSLAARLKASGEKKPDDVLKDKPFTIDPALRAKLFPK